MTERQKEPLGRVRTKIVATLGPASRGPEVLKSLVEAGVDVFRLNFSHGTHEEHTATLRAVREVAESCGRVIAVLQDLGGPKIRLGSIPGGSIECMIGDEFRLARERTGDDPREFTCTYKNLIDDLKVGDEVYFADGAVAMAVTSASPGPVRLKVTLAGLVRSKQGLNMPGAALGVQALTEKDLADLDWSAENSVDYIGLSFVREAADVVRLRKELAARGIKARIVAKIEKPQAVANLDAIIEEADAVMVARGDLGVEMDVARVPAIQKRVIAACHHARVPVITATQMLNSMETSNRPTRAEATDVFNAVLDGTDAVMLSGETAVGLYPVETVSTMSRIVTEAEALLVGDHASTWSAVGAKPPVPLRQGNAGWVMPVTEAVVEAVRLLARRLDAKLVVVSTKSGRTALALSKQRYAPPTVALADDLGVARSLALCWGVTPLFRPAAAGPEDSTALACGWALTHGLAAPGDNVLVVQGTTPNHPGHNAVIVRQVE